MWMVMRGIQRGQKSDEVKQIIKRKPVFHIMRRKTEGNKESRVIKRKVEGLEKGVRVMGKRK